MLQNNMIFYKIDRRQAGAADAKRLIGKWAKAHFPYGGLGADLPPTSRMGTIISERKCSHHTLLAN
jgi:hypothetical protein